MIVCINKQTQEIYQGRADSQPGVMIAEISVARKISADMLAEVEMSQEEFEEKMAVQREAQLNYKQRRVREYPSIGDQLDALFHAGVFPEDMAAKIQAVKNKYPKV